MTRLAELFDLHLGDWRFQAACKGEDPGLFFPRRIEDSSPAKAVCAECPVRVACLDEAIAKREPAGIWGGKDARERRAIARNRGLPLAPRTGVEYQ